MRGISEIIAIVLMLLIVIGLAGTAFVYIQSTLVGNIAGQISLIDVSCVSTPQPGTVYATVKNIDPKIPLDTSNLLIRWDNNPTSLNLTGWFPVSVGTYNVTVGTFTCASGVCLVGSSHTLKIIGSSSSVEKSTYC